ncbi:hypothetical protein GCM10010405_42170 [Streptomyces macrosporus]|uniref:Uncharacterized protein n=1 Tax=Streptomyces macrosporus TaxID=44032 RepID=A0ABN3KA35_9ACTN
MEPPVEKASVDCGACRQRAADFHAVYRPRGGAERYGGTFRRGGADRRRAVPAADQARFPSDFGVRSGPVGRREARRPRPLRVGAGTGRPVSVSPVGSRSR